MTSIHLVAVRAAAGAAPGGGDDGAVDLDLLDGIAAALAGAFRVSCRVHAEPIDARFAFDPARNQYHSTRILQCLVALAPTLAGPGGALLAITALDLYVPILTFVFGEAQRPGLCAVVSIHRLREEFYGLPENRERVRERVVKESLHEMGHTMGLSHCEDWRCVMASAHAVERLDLRGAAFCGGCRAAITRPSPT